MRRQKKKSTARQTFLTNSRGGALEGGLAVTGGQSRNLNRAIEVPTKKAADTAYRKELLTIKGKGILMDLHLHQRGS